MTRAAKREDRRMYRFYYPSLLCYLSNVFQGAVVKAKKKPLSVYLDEVERREVVRLAAEVGVSESSYVRMLIIERIRSEG